MRKGHFEKPRMHSAVGRALLMAAALVILLTAAIGGTVAYIADSSAELENRFLPVQVSCEASASESGASVTNTSDVDAWIRAHLVVNWMDDNGNVYAIAPQAAVQYDADWKEVNGILYYTQPVASNATVVLTSSISVSGKAPEGYTLTVEVVSEAIQAEGTTEDGTKAVVDAWGLDPAALS